MAGVTTRAISGTVLSRNRQWLSTCINYAENIFITMFILRFFPRVFCRWIAIFLPSSWATYKSLRRGKKLLIPIIEERLKEKAFARREYKKPPDLLQYMIEGAEGDDLEPERLAHLQLMVNLAGIHTTSTAITHAVHDLCEHNEYVKVLREEIEDVLRQDGGWQTETHKRLHKLDSFLKESQRFSPPTLCLSSFSFHLHESIINVVKMLTLLVSFNRVALASITLSSGIKIPAGTHLSVASRNILFDPEMTPDPDTFDGLRYYKLRGQSGESLKHDFASVDGINMNFGAGRYACPGRFFASMELKLLLAKLLLEFDFKFPPGTGRPPLLVVDELVAPAPWAKVMIRRRQKVS